MDELLLIGQEIRPRKGQTLQMFNASLRSTEVSQRKKLSEILPDPQKRRLAEAQLRQGINHFLCVLEDRPNELIDDPECLDRCALHVRYTASLVEPKEWPSLHTIARDFETLAERTRPMRLGIVLAKQHMPQCNGKN